jgi:hypothetical protein
MRFLTAAAFGVNVAESMASAEECTQPSGPIATDRPDTTNSSVVVPVGSLQNENGINVSRRDGSDLFSLPINVVNATRPRAKRKARPKPRPKVRTKNSDDGGHYADPFWQSNQSAPPSFTKANVRLGGDEADVYWTSPKLPTLRSR